MFKFVSLFLSILCLNVPYLSDFPAPSKGQGGIPALDSYLLRSRVSKASLKCIKEGLRETLMGGQREPGGVIHATQGPL